MDISQSFPQAKQADTSPPPPRIPRVEDQAIATDQRKEEDDSSRLPRIPRATDDCPRPLTIDELCDWKALFQLKLKRRNPTQSERDDAEECDRQWHQTGSVTSEDWSEDDRYMDTLPSPKQRRYPAWCSSYQAKRDARKQPLSPPRTPPHLRIARPYRDPSPELQSSIFRVQKSKANPRVALRRPVTRSGGTPAISLHDRKGYIKLWNLPWQYVVISYEQYLRDFVSSVRCAIKHVLTQSQDREELDKHPVERVDWSFESPRYPFKTPYQREVCRRGKAQDVLLKDAVKVRWYYKGHR